MFVSGSEWEDMGIMKFNRVGDNYVLDMEWFQDMVRRQYNIIELPVEFQNGIKLTNEERIKKELDNRVEVYDNFIDKFKTFLFMTRIQEDVSYISNLESISSNTREVLNRSNPFADVAIEDNSYFYPDKDGFKVLSFKTGYHVFLEAIEEGTVCNLTPSFSVEKSDNYNTQASILFDKDLIEPIDDLEDVIYV